jgi:hypothetical protein
LYFERYGFDPELRDEYNYKFLVVFLIASRQILKYDLEMGNCHLLSNPLQSSDQQYH